MKMRITVKPMRSFVVVLLLALAVSLGSHPASASGVPYNVGDVFASVGAGKIKHFSSTGLLLDTLDTTTGSPENAGMAFDLAGNLYATQFEAGVVSKFDNAGNLLNAAWVGGLDGNHPESIVRDFAGNFYVGQADGTHQVLKFSASGGAPIATFSPATESRGTDWIDLAADQCTLFYTSEGKHIKRFNVCTNTQLADFNAVPLAGTNAYALRIRPNQEVLVADTSAVYRLNSSGTVIQTYTFAGTSTLFALNLDNDLTSFWTGDLVNGQVFKVDIATGAVLETFNVGLTGGSPLGGLAVFGEVTAAQPKLTLAPATDTKAVGNSETLTAALVNVLNPAGTPIKFTVTGANPQTATVPADATGNAMFTYTGNNAGVDSAVATATTAAPAAPPGASLTSNTAAITWTKAPTTLTYTGATTSDYHDPATVSVTLQSAVTSAPIAGATINFQLDSQLPNPNCSGVTAATGKASCSLTPTLQAGTYTLTASFAGNANFLGSSATASFVVTREETTTTYTGPTVIANGYAVTLSGVLKEDGITPIAGRTLTLTLGTGVSAQSCTTPPTNASGAASCTISTVNQPLGPGTVSAAFAGDAFYLPSSDKKATILFAFATANGGTFVVGDKSASGAVEFWGSDWANVNSLSGGVAPDAFKGFAGTPSSNPPACGKTWSTLPGNSPPPPASIPLYLGVIVASSIAQFTPTISGNIVHIIVVKTDPGYGPDPGMAGTGTVVATFC